MIDAMVGIEVCEYGFEIYSFLTFVSAGLL